MYYSYQHMSGLLGIYWLFIGYLVVMFLEFLLDIFWLLYLLLQVRFAYFFYQKISIFTEINGIKYYIFNNTSYEDPSGNNFWWPIIGITNQVK